MLNYVNLLIFTYLHFKHYDIIKLRGEIIMVNIKRLLSELSLEELQELKNNPSIINEVINEESYDQASTLQMAESYTLEGTQARVFIPKYKIIDDKNLAQQLLSQNGLLFEQLSEELKKDETLLRIAFNQNPYVLYNLPEEMIRKVVNKSREEVKHILEEGGTKEVIYNNLRGIVSVKSTEDLKETASNWLNSDSVKNAQIDKSKPTFQANGQTYYRTTADPLLMEYSLTPEKEKELEMQLHNRQQDAQRFFQEGLAAGKTLEQLKEEYLAQNNGPHR